MGGGEGGGRFISENGASKTETILSCSAKQRGSIYFFRSQLQLLKTAQAKFSAVLDSPQRSGIHEHQTEMNGFVALCRKLTLLLLADPDAPTLVEATR